jgi:Down syndrome cell adhesion protein
MNTIITYLNVFHPPVFSVLIRQYIAYSVRVNDEYITMGNTAVFKCNIDPYFVRDYITVTAWTRGAARVEAGRKG